MTTGRASFFSHGTPEPREAAGQWVGGGCGSGFVPGGAAGHVGDIDRRPHEDGQEQEFTSSPDGCGGGYGDRRPNGARRPRFHSAGQRKPAWRSTACASRHVNATAAPPAGHGG